MKELKGVNINTEPPMMLRLAIRLQFCHLTPQNLLNSICERRVVYSTSVVKKISDVLGQIGNPNGTRHVHSKFTVKYVAAVHSPNKLLFEVKTPVTSDCSCWEFILSFEFRLASFNMRIVESELGDTSCKWQHPCDHG